jgi:hypothetical protein
MSAARLARDRKAASLPEQQFGPSLATEEVPGTTGRQEDFVTQLIRYTPTEVVGLYVAALAVLPAIPSAEGRGSQLWDYDFRWRWGVFVFFVFGSALAVFAVHSANARAAHQEFTLPLFEMIVAPVAFAAWALALPLAPLFSWHRWHAWVGALLGVLTLFLIGTIAKATGRALTYAPE